MPTKFDKNYWSQRYLNDDTAWDAGRITTPLKEYIDQLRDKHIAILIPGAGNAHEADYLIAKGFTNVSVIDISEEPLKNIQRRLPGFPPERLIPGDFFEHTNRYDLILEQTFFCALDRSLRQKYAEQMHKLLTKKGKLVGVLFSGELNTDQPPFGGNKEEYTSYFENYFDLNTLAPCYNSIKPRAGRELFINFQKKD